MERRNVVGARDLDGVAAVAPDRGREAYERRAARAADADEQGAAARLRDNARDTREVHACVGEEDEVHRLGRGDVVVVEKLCGERSGSEALTHDVQTRCHQACRSCANVSWVSQLRMGERGRAGAPVLADVYESVQVMYRGEDSRGVAL
eukprot:3580476-Pleurochrysis_carterae.AAC.1